MSLGASGYRIRSESFRHQKKITRVGDRQADGDSDKDNKYNI